MIEGFVIGAGIAAFILVLTICLGYVRAPDVCLRRAGFFVALHGVIGAAVGLVVNLF